ncbi:hypothetical protein ACFSM7_07730 [Clavibacter michiganensis subsp. tessellarius]|uniref:hypothetical protein n=1 Tax=Clavibacter tessellarius TaxID=31965 RepID=UPI00364565F0
MRRHPLSATVGSRVAPASAPVGCAQLQEIRPARPGGRDVRRRLGGCRMECR